MGVTFFTLRHRKRRQHPELPVVAFHPSDHKVVVKTMQDVRESEYQDFVMSSCPSLFRKYTPPWWLKSGHIQTIYCALGDFTEIDPVDYRRTHLRTKDGGTIGLDWVVDDHHGYNSDTPIIVILHGLTGGSHESYVRCILTEACRPTHEGGLGYRAVVMNFRGCAGTPITSPQLYNAGYTDDARTALLYIQSVYPDAPLLGLGFSLGANVLTRYLGEEGKNSRLSSGCILGCPWNLDLNNTELKKTWVGKNIYSKGMGSNLQRILRVNKKGLTADAEHPMSKYTSKAISLKSPTLDEFDGCFTANVGLSSAPFPFASARDYYRWASSHHSLSTVGVPLLSINAIDDPVVRAFPRVGNNGWVVMTYTRYGGHLGWWLGLKKRWVVQPALEWFKATSSIISNSRNCGPKIYESDGWLLEEGNDRIACKVVDMKSVIPNSLTKQERLAQKFKGGDDVAPIAGL